MELNKIICGDALKELKKMPSEFVDCVITSPPYYALRNYGVDGQLGLEKTFEEYQKKLLEIIAEIKRVLKPTGQFWLNLGDIYGGTRWTNQAGTGPWAEKSFAAKANINPKRGFDKKNYGGLGQKRQDTTRQGRGRGEGDASKCLTMMPERIAIAMCDQQGWLLRNKIKWVKQVLDFGEYKTKGSVMPTSVKDRFNESGEELYFFVKNKKYYSDLDAIRIPVQTMENRLMGIDFVNIKETEMFYSPKGRTQRKRNGFTPYEEAIGKSWHDHSQDKIRGAGQKNIRCQHPSGKNIPSVWLIQSEPHNFRNELGIDIDHFAIFPQALVEIPIRFGSPSGGVVLDPFMGSGTTAYVACQLGRNYIGIEISEKYVELANKRLSQGMMKL